MKGKHIQLHEIEEEKSQDHLRRSVAVPISLIKPTVDGEDIQSAERRGPAAPSCVLFFFVLFVLLGLTLVVFAIISHSKSTAVFGVPLWVVGGALISGGLLGAYCLLFKENGGAEARVSLELDESEDSP
jgi:hypothetical protein